MTKHVEVYRNLHNGKLSVRDRKTHLVIGHVDYITLCCVRFRVSQAGRERVLRERRKNVHAFVVGKIIEFGGADNYKDRNLKEYVYERGRNLCLFDNGTVATYNPYKYESFVIPQEGYRKIENAHMCHINQSGIHLGHVSKGGVNRIDPNAVPRNLDEEIN